MLASGGHSSAPSTLWLPTGKTPLPASRHKTPTIQSPSPPSLKEHACPRPPHHRHLPPDIVVHNAAGETTLSAASTTTIITLDNLDSPVTIAADPAQPPTSPPSTISQQAATPSIPRHNNHSLSVVSLLDCHSDTDNQVRLSRRDTHLHSTKTNTFNTFWPTGFNSLRRNIVGAVSCPALPPFPPPSVFTMSSRRRKSGVPASPRVISPSPDPSDHETSYERPMTRSAARNRNSTSQTSTDDIDDIDDEAPGLRRSRTRSRSPGMDTRSVPRMTPRNTINKPEKIPEAEEETVSPPSKTNGKAPTANGHLAPPELTIGGWSWRSLSRSPSPLGLIPIHRHWRTFVHKHEVPRKILHVSIGFFVVWLYVRGTQTSSVAPWLMSALIPITTTDWLRHRYASVNRFYVRMLGALMRESEFAGWNGVIFYLLGAWIVLYFFPKDVGVMSVLLLSWCDTAASTFGRLWGRYTPRIRRGKSFAGSMAAFLVGVATSYFFWGWLVNYIGPKPGDENFMFQGVLTLPSTVSNALGLSESQASISGSLALGVMGLWSGFVASASEVVDIFGWDDNLTIPVLSGLGMWGFLKVFT